MALPVSAPALTNVGAAQTGLNDAASQQVSHTLDRKLADYVAALQAGGGYGAQNTAPSALGSEAARWLKEYLEHSAKFRSGATRRVTPMRESAESATAGKNEVKVASLPGGPASSELSPAASLRDSDGSGLVSAGAGVTDAEMDEVVAKFVELLNFGTETAFIGKATTEMTKSVNTLLRGQ